jgi:glycosyltransferase involved in cell wall biosynthesis
VTRSATCSAVLGNPFIRMFDLSSLDICFLAGTLGQGGAERQLFYVIRSLRNNAANVRLLCLTKGEFWEGKIAELGIDVTWVGRSRSRAARLANIILALRTRPPRVLQSQHFYTNLYATLASRALGIREIGAIRSDGAADVRSNGRVMGPLSLRAPRLVAANSNAAIANARALGVPPGRLYLLPNMVDSDEFKPSSRRANGEVRLLSAGRLGPEKRIDRFLSILGEVIKFSPAKVRAIVAGEGPLRGHLERRAEALGLIPEVVEFRGAVSDMTSLYQEVDLLVMTSDWEGSPNVALEAMSSGLPVVTTNVGGAAEVVRDGETGFVCDPGAEEKMRDRLLDLISSRVLRQEMGSRGRQHVVSKHSSHRLEATLAEMYQTALS